MVMVNIVPQLIRSIRCRNRAVALGRMPSPCFACFSAAYEREGQPKVGWPHTDCAVATSRTTTAERLNSDLKMGKRSEEHTSELQSLMRISYAVFCLKKKKKTHLSINIRKSQLVKHN